MIHADVCSTVTGADPDGSVEVTVINVGGADTTGTYSCLLDDGTEDDDYFEYNGIDDASSGIGPDSDELWEGTTGEPTPAPTDGM